MRDLASETVADWPDAPAFSYTGAAARAPLLIGVAVVAAGLLPLLIGAIGLLAKAVPGTVPFAGLFASSKSIASVIVFAALTALGLVESLFGVWLARWMTALQPALAVSAEGIFAFQSGKPWRSLAWSEVTSVVKLRSRGPKTGQGVITVRIEAPRCRLQMSSQITGYAEACQLLTRHARAHGITLLDQTGAGPTTGEVAAL
jgi:hypothetical protein